MTVAQRLCKRRIAPAVTVIQDTMGSTTEEDLQHSVVAVHGGQVQWSAIVIISLGHRRTNLNKPSNQRRVTDRRCLANFSKELIASVLRPLV